jgi:glycosyltransferase involved in cell wall biosynthesis
LVERVVARRADWHWVFIGDEREGQSHPIIARLRRRPNVHILGWRPYASLPSYLRAIDIALLPQRLNDYTRAMFPMKFFEYLAAGRRIVGTRLPALAEFEALYHAVASAEDMADTIDRLLARPGDAVVALDDPILRTHSWATRIDAMLSIVNGPALDDRGSAAHRPLHRPPSHGG